MIITGCKLLTKNEAYANIIIMTSEIQNTAPNPGSSVEALGAEISAKASPVDYAELVGDSPVLMLGENHGNGCIRDHIAEHAVQLRAAGITHYAIEAPHDSAFDELNAGGQISLDHVDLGPFSRQDRSYERAVRAVAVQGIKVVPIDIDQSIKPTKEEREAFLTDGVLTILADDPSAKVAVLMGGFHAVKKKSPHSVSSMTTRLVDKGVGVVAAQYAGGTESAPTLFLGAASGAGMGQSEFMMNLRPYQDNPSVVYGPGVADCVIHLPQEASARSDNAASRLGTMAFGGGFGFTKLS